MKRMKKVDDGDAVCLCCALANTLPYALCMYGDGGGVAKSFGDFGAVKTAMRRFRRKIEVRRAEHKMSAV
jgi:hypothetical protein